MRDLLHQHMRDLLHCLKTFGWTRGSWLRFVKIIHKTPYAGVAYLQARECLVANIAVFCSLRKRLNARRLYYFRVKRMFPLDAICVILARNMRHITLQYASYQAPICHLWHPKRWLLRLRSIFSGCRKCLFTTFSLVEWRKMLMVFCQNNSH